MTIYILKTVICSALLIGIYLLILEKEKMHSFNRFYLLFAIIFSFIVPVITIKTGIPTLLLSEPVTATVFNLQSTETLKLIPSKQTNILINDLLLIVYLIITTYLFARFLINVHHMLVKIRNSRKIIYLESKIVLASENTTPHSFLNYIVVSGKDFDDGMIEKEILSHELAHAKQRHSLDILLIEIITVFAWINPILFLYKRAILLNHEFLADEFVIESFKDIHSYQMLLIGKSIQPDIISFASPFNYLDIKKRILMMRKKISLKSAILKQIAVIPAFAIFTLLFASKTFAQEPIKVTVQTKATQLGVSQDLLNEYQATLDKYKTAGPDEKKGYNLTMSQEDKDKLEKIFFRMSKEQQDNQMIAFVPKNSMVLRKTVPSKEQFESFKDPEMYGVWIDGNRVNNEDLNHFVNTDFSSVFISILLKNATNYGQHKYQVDLMTNKGYQDYYNMTITQEGNMMLPASLKSKVKKP